MSTISPQVQELSGQEMVISPEGGRRAFAFGELWRYRDLWLMLAWRDVQIRYKQTVLGVAWAVIQPVVSMVVLHLVFGHYFGLAPITGKVHYAIFLFAALVPWTFFSSSVTACGNSFVANAHILQKVYFPRLLIPLSSLGAPLVDYGIGTCVLGGLMWWFDVVPTWTLLLLPAFVVSVVIAALGVGIFLASVTVSYRDFRHVVPFLLQTWFFVTPVIVPETAVGAHHRWMLDLNPLSGIVAGFRDATLGREINYFSWGLGTGMSVVLLMIGLICFARTERKFADVI